MENVIKKIKELEPLEKIDIEIQGVKYEGIKSEEHANILELHLEGKQVGYVDTMRKTFVLFAGTLAGKFFDLVEGLFLKLFNKETGQPIE